MSLFLGGVCVGGVLCIYIYIYLIYLNLYLMYTIVYLSDSHRGGLKESMVPLAYGGASRRDYERRWTPGKNHGVTTRRGAEGVLPARGTPRAESEPSWIDPTIWIV